MQHQHSSRHMATLMFMPSRSASDTVSASLISWPMTSGQKGLLLSCAVWKLRHFLEKCRSFHARCRNPCWSLVIFCGESPQKMKKFSFELHSNLFFLTTSTTACWLGLSLLLKLQVSSELRILRLLTLAGQLLRQCTCKADYPDTLWLLATTAKN